jgi:transposase
MAWRRGKSYSQDLRDRVLATADDGARVGQVAALLRVGVSHASKVLGRRRATGETTARARRGHMPPKLAALHGAIRERVAARPDATIAELRAWLAAAHTTTASDGLVCLTLARLGLTRKKSRSGRPSRTVRTSPRRAPNGARRSQASTPRGWSSSTRPG